MHQLLTWDDVYTLDRLNLQTCDGKTVDVKASENRGSRLIQTPDGDEISIRFQSIWFHVIMNQEIITLGLEFQRIRQ